MTAADLNTVAAAGAMLRGMLGAGFGTAALDVYADHAPLMAGEAAAVARAVPARRREFAAGRAAARLAMAQLGLPARPVPQGPDRAPVWPIGLAGSIAHAAGCCLAAVAPHQMARSLGIDLEPDAPLDDELCAEVCTGAELAGLAALPATMRGRHARLVFSAKECVFKAQYPLTSAMLGFDAVEIEATPGKGRFAAVFRHGVGPFGPGQRLVGRCASGAGLIVTALVLRP
jgi:4'-phosphopantetheinyl transferase EntD